MKKFIILSIAVFFSVSLSAQKIALKNNLLYDATLTPNLALEFGLGKRSTLEIGGGWNPFEFSNDRKFKHWLVQPELRFWPCERFNGLFFGIHGHGGEFNIAKLDLPFGLFDSLKDHRYEGHFYGGGVSIGYQFILGRRWNFEMSVGGGYAYIDYDKYECGDCGLKLESDTKNYWGVTRASLSFVYFFK